MNNPPPNKMFDARYEKRWPRTTAALKRLETLADRYLALQAAHGEMDPRVPAAKQQAAVAADALKATEADEARAASAGGKRA